LRVPFVKMHGAANDFVVVDHRRPFLVEPLAPLVAALCDRRRGVGADGVLLLEPDPDNDFAMRYFNSDGRIADYCGNGARCLARFAFDLGLGSGSPRRVRFRTSVGVQTAREIPGGVAVHFGVVPPPGHALEVGADGRRFVGRLIRAGVPHFVTAVSRVAEVPLDRWAPPLRRHESFGSEGANVDFVARLKPGTLAMRTFERGVEAETLACGSGAIASALWAAAEGDASPVTVCTAGGDELRVDFERTSAGLDVTLSGPAVTVFQGEWRERAAAPGAIAPVPGA
jgi:diaminopimelate epimerase